MNKVKKDNGPKKTGKPTGKKSTIFKVKQEDELMKFLIANLPGKNRNNIKTLLKRRQVIVDGKAISQFNHRLYPGNVVEISRQRARNTPQLKGVTIVYEDHDLIVVNKRPGLLSVSSDREKFQTVVKMVQDYIRVEDPKGQVYAINRLDKDTSGLLLLAKNRVIRDELKKNWIAFVQGQTYLAVVEGVPTTKEGSYKSFLTVDGNYVVHSSEISGPESKEASIDYQVISSNEFYSILKIRMFPGIKNQIRVQLKALGYPVTGDRKYGATANPLLRLGLHCRELSFVHPLSNRTLNFKTAVPGKFLKLMNLKEQSL